ncbi:TRAP transporter substrate-binding protein DctP [Acuticoccus sediminis]|uniref:TRAP transporter small permease protein n=1 Tax=Acuticoccus sediminis TaxID=2184697 RepID=A0A8B2NVM9_9HYPH|nr:TRAP transporter small permease [Acuticoccus sediminis]RAI03413.1 TRAP transporter substrate-binding protein DctP [Acuticoccus sediminis]
MTQSGRTGPLRHTLDGVYLVSGVLAGLFLMGIALSIIAQIIGRFVGVTIDGTELAGFCMAASTFLGLAYTLKSGTHVRVNLATRGLPAGIKQVVEVLCCLIGLAASAYFTYFSIRLAMQSYQFGDVSPGLIAAPFWIPQTGMAIGGGLLVIAFVDELILVLKGEMPGYQTEEGVLAGKPIDSTNPDAGMPADVERSI